MRRGEFPTVGELARFQDEDRRGQRVPDLINRHREAEPGRRAGRLRDVATGDARAQLASAGSSVDQRGVILSRGHRPRT